MLPLLAKNRPATVQKDTVYYMIERMLSRKQSYRVKIYGKPTKGVVLFFCPFGVRRWQFLLPHLPISSLVNAGFEVICYDFNTFKVTTSPSESRRILHDVLQDVQHKVDDSKNHGIGNISVFGASLGSLFAAYCAANITDVNKVILNLTYGDIVDHILDMPGMLFLPKRRLNNYVALGGGEEKLRKFFAGYSPLDNISALRKKKILLYLSKKDKVLQYTNSVRLKKALEVSANLQYIENRTFGHYWAATYNHFNRKVYIEFLLS